MSSDDGSTDGTFVGRRNELASLLAQAAEVRRGHPRVALLTGEPGIGKTALAHRFVSQAPGFHLWEASGEEAEQLLTFGVIEQLVRASPVAGGPALAEPRQRGSRSARSDLGGRGAARPARGDAGRRSGVPVDRRRSVG